MDSLLLSSEDTYLLLARQGYAAQGRRRSAMRHSTMLSRQSVSTTTSESTSPVDSAFPADNDYMQQATEAEKQAVPISLPALKTDSSTAAADMQPSMSPSSRSLLHERFMDQLQDTIIEEEDGGDGVVIYNGLKRLSLSEAGLVVQGRPRIVHI
ncbi:hypothetical protein IWW54_003653 [Coemansia sp. RSA 2705]|nr:hypothetical protein IWW54_003653 [Coemansia sp. RSA 2705]